MRRAALLGLLGAALATAVSSMPADTRTHNEEMVTRCIIEVLSNALLKSNAPPITPECRQVLRKSGKEVKDEEKSENENTRFAVRLLRDQADASEARRPSSREDRGDPGEEGTQGLSVASREGGGHSREGAGEPQGGLYPSDSQVSKEAKTHHSEKSVGEGREGEDGERDRQMGRGDGGREEGHLEEPGETHEAVPDARNQASAGKTEAMVARYDTRSARLPEKTHSRERSSQESRESKSQSGSQEESEESEEDASHEADKRRWRPRHHHGRSRPDRSSQERGQPRSEPEGSNAAVASLGDERDRYPAHSRASEEEPEYGEVVGGYTGLRAPENLEGGKGGAPRPPRAEGQGDKRNRPSLDLDSMAYGYGEESAGRGPGWGYVPRARPGEPGAYPLPGKGEKQPLGGGHYPVHESHVDRARAPLQGGWEELDRNDLGYGEETAEDGAHGTWPQQEGLRDTDTKETREGARLAGTRYAPDRTTHRSRAGELLPRYYAPSPGRGGHQGREDSLDDSFPEGEDGNGPALTEKSFFPEYNYDWWERKPFEDDVSWGYEKRSLGPGLDLKRQYDRVAELDQLLHYRKKSAEFPDFYDPEEPLVPRRAGDSAKDRAGPGVLTEEEEKELENLAAMDLELQKIAEKFSGNRRG